MLFIYNSQQYKELDIKGFLVKSLLYIWNTCLLSPIFDQIQRN